jgi:hypothetical protein
MKPSAQTVSIGENWPPFEGEVVSFNSPAGLKSGVLREVRWGLVWRDFVLEDGRVIPEHRIEGCPESPTWRRADEVSQAEREAWEERLVCLAESGVDPKDREQTFWAELNQYLAYIYLKFQRTQELSGEPRPPGEVHSSFRIEGNR